MPRPRSGGETEWDHRGGYDLREAQSEKTSQARDLASILDRLQVQLGGDHSYGASMKTELESWPAMFRERSLRTPGIGSWRSNRSRPSPLSQGSSPEK